MNSSADYKDPLLVNILGDLEHKWGWLLALGILFVLLGAIGLGMTFIITLATNKIRCWLYHPSSLSLSTVENSPHHFTIK